MVAENNRGKNVYRAIYDKLPENTYYDWLDFWGITQKELDTFMEAGEEAVNRMYDVESEARIVAFEEESRNG